MTIPEAIEILTQDKAHAQAFGAADQRNAIELGIQALKRHQLAPTLTRHLMTLPLPGETKEKDDDH
jgi:hypothetical protein